MFKPRRGFLAFLALIVVLACTPESSSSDKSISMIATAYSTDGIQKAGTVAREGTAAADPKVLPLGSRVRVHGPDGYIGEFVISDTGSAVKGNHIDIFFDSPAQAKKFGQHEVRVEILEVGTGPQSAKKEVREGVSPPVKQ